jgi:site-specific recombinase XerD
MSTQKQIKSLSNLINYYELCNKSEGKSQKTVSWYTANLRQLRHYLQARHLSDSVDNIDLQVLREYVFYLLKKKRFADHPYTPQRQEFLSAATVHGHVRTLRAFFSWLLREGLAQHNVAKGLRPPKVPKRVISTLSDAEILSILDVLDPRNPCDARNRTIVMILLDSGLRVGEVIDLKLDDINLDQGLLKVMGKGQKERIVPIGNSAQRALQKYLFRHRPEPAHPGVDNVFLSAAGAPLTENSLKLTFARLESRLEESKERHRFISLLNDPLTSGYNEYGPLVVVVAKSMLEWVSNHCQHFRSFYVIESGLKTLIKQLGGN